MKCSLDLEPLVAVVRVSGHLDLASVVTLRAVMLKGLAAQPEAVLVDAAELVLTGDIHLTALAAAARYAAAWPSIPVILCGPSPDVASAARRMGIDGHVPMCPTVADGRRLAAERVASPRVTDFYPPARESVASARNLVAETCLGWGLRGPALPAELVVAELMANAVLHAGTRSQLIVSRSTRYLHVAVRDYCSLPARLVGPTGEMEPHGRGLLVVEALATHWGCTPTSDGKVTWATLALDRR